MSERLLCDQPALPLHPLADTIGQETLPVGRGRFRNYGENRTVDLVLLAKENPDYVKLLRRGDNGLLANAGGFIDPGETPLEAVVREAGEELSIQVNPATLNEFYDDIVRDHGEALNAWPRTTAYVGSIAFELATRADDDAVEGSDDWYYIPDLTPEQLHGSHYVLIQMAKKAIAATSQNPAPEQTVS